MNVLIVEDNELFVNSNARSMKVLANKYNIDMKVKVFTNVGDLLYQHIKEESIDLALLDVEIGNHDGVKVGKKIVKYHPLVSLVFITLYRKYLDRASVLDPIGFLVKPVQFDRLEKLFCKAVMLKQGLLSLEEKNTKFVTVMENRNKMEIKECEILYIRTCQRKLLLKVGERNILISETISSFEKGLSDLFIKIARDILVNKRKVKEVRGMQIIMCNGDSLDISWRKFQEVIRKLHT
ncbi:LytR/AlgR family response regulator transcription factor [[Clostridium] polysaccharolyticum]|nr:response regulator [[Clostridium] polysaccharolyticum]